jgi:hypothetical protein
LIGFAQLADHNGVAQNANGNRMRIPKDAKITVSTDNERVELHITATLATRAQANELSAAIKAFAYLLEGAQRVRKPKLAAVG